MKKYLYLPLAFIFASIIFANAQSTDEDAIKIKEIYDNALTKSSGYEWLRHLCKQIGHRTSGSGNYMAAVEYTKQMMDSLGLDSVWLQPVVVPHWERGSIEKCRVISQQLGTYELSAAALGNSGATPDVGITAQVIEVKSIAELEELGAAKVKGKFVFFNRPMDPTAISPGSAYGSAGDQRFAGPGVAAKLGAVGALVRSLTHLYDDTPHSGTTHFDDDVTPIPSVGLGIQSAEMLSKILKAEPNTTVNIRLNCRKYEDKKAYSVIGEIKGTRFPNEIIVVGGHLDSWDIGEGANDDGAGCIHAMSTLEILKKTNIKPKRTIRCVLFANEENGMKGAYEYADYAKKNTTEKHIVAIESDGGNGSPRGFSADGLDSLMRKNIQTLREYKNLLAPYGAYEMEAGGSGADVGRLKEQNVLLFGYRADNQRYFDYHHSRNDVFENINKRELELSVGTIASLIYLLDKYGVK